MYRILILAAFYQLELLIRVTWKKKSCGPLIRSVLMKSDVAGYILRTPYIQGNDSVSSPNDILHTEYKYTFGRSTRYRHTGLLPVVPYSSYSSCSLYLRTFVPSYLQSFLTFPPSVGFCVKTTRCMLFVNMENTSQPSWQSASFNCSMRDYCKWLGLWVPIVPEADRHLSDLGLFTICGVRGKSIIPMTLHAQFTS